ncbi:nicotinate-nucleotide--dimethylbenzimidazole phosphoribosyltransferase [Streptomyces sp. SID13726]|uniref:nicotinate-nucleotide--dimethylbenzimidazole phosphoribosyltransferase n=1 Tax=Streptomyces sp. SID13726 TaxID=2706058 RepID=UPI0013BE459A|nr:nicotinate-nucleotide--dimethylbenzimidazole phosphoribosyltransferase [Streptomyces sp. SID13726]NEB02390.1 nicotinate-nucleotide--dimethylbenzimidazole phosphoribosyltransferase [Streptomyces sp. SID13726]
MTDTGQVPGEGLPENAGMVEQPGVPAPGAYTYLSETTAEDEDLLLLPGAQSPWGNEVAPPAPEPVVDAVHEPGPHEMSGRDSGAHDLSAVRTARAPSTPIPPITPRRPLHLGPPIPDASASPVRSLADRGPAGAPVRQPAVAAPGTEYFDAPQPQGAVPWGAPSQAAVQTPVSTVAQAAETVVPAPEPVGAAQAAVARLASEAGAAGYEVPTEAPVAAEGAYAPEPAEVPAPGTGQVLEDGGDSGDGSVPVAAVDPAAEQGSVEGADLGAGQVPGDGSVPDAALGEVPGEGVALDAAQVVADAAQVVAEDAAEAAEAVPVTEDVQAGDVAEAAPAAEEPLPEAVAVEGTPAPEAAVPDAVAPEVVEPVAEAVVPEVEIAGAESPTDGQVADAEEAPQAADVPETVVVEDAGLSAETDAAQVLAAAEEPVAAEETDALPESEGAVATPEAAPPTEEAAPLAAELAGPEAALPGEMPVAESAPDAPEAVALPEAVEPEQAPQPTEVPAEDAVAAPLPEPQAEQPVPAPEQAQESAPDTLPVAGPQDPHLLPAPDSAEPVAAEPAAVDVQPMDPAPEAQPLSAPTAPEDVTAIPDQAPQGPQPLPAELPDAQPQFADAAAAEVPVVLPAGVPTEPQPGQPLGEFVPVDGQVPTTPHLAPTPPHPLRLPVDDGQQPVVPAPREADADAELVQQADDLDTRAADQEDQDVQQVQGDQHVQQVQEEVSTAPVEEARQSTGPAAPAYDDAEREAVLKVMRERRDIRNGFRSDPIPHEVLLRVLEAAHTAPSVGHSQPWDFVVIRSAETRGAMHELAQRQRDAYAKSLPKGRAKQFKELKIEAILDTPVNIVVTADPTRGGRHTLGRHTQPQMAPYSAALAVENLWLAARAEGLGVGWVSFFDEREMVRALGLPEHLEVIAYLCVGYVDEFPDEPELMQAGWSKRRPLSWVVHEETYGRRALPGEEPHDLLGETVAQIRPLDAKALGEAWERQKRMTKPPGSLGMLEIISAQLSGLSRQCPPPIPEPAAVAIFAGDHGVHAQGVTPWPQEVTAQMVANFLGGGAVCNAFAGQVGAEVCVVDVGVAAELPATPGLLPRKIRAGTSDMTTGPAMSREEAKQAIEVGIETARDLVAAGNKALLTGEMGIANTTASAALISVFTGTDPAEVTGRGTGINDETLARKTEVVRRAIELHSPDPADPIGVLAAIGGFEHAAMVGLLLGGASLRTPVILDGVSAGAAALVARAIAPEVLAACIAGHRSAEPGHVAALNKLGLRPLVDLDLRLGEGTGALLALPLVQSTARAMHEVATFDSAGVTEK